MNLSVARTRPPANVPLLTAQVLFDNTKTETAGNADGIMGMHLPISSPSITGDIQPEFLRLHLG